MTDITHLTFGPSEIPLHEIKLVDLIGSGNFGAVYRAFCRGHEVAVKIPHIKNISDEDIKSFKDEVTIMSKNTHPNIIRFMGACTEPDQLHIVTEICKGGNLETLLYNPEYQGDLFERLKMARDIVNGMIWLHANNIIHGDLKPANLLIDHLGQIKIADFGFSQLKRSTPPVEDEAVKGTPTWTAPEKLLRELITEKSDVFSFGIILYEIVTRKEPYSHKDFSGNIVAFCESVCSDDLRPLLTPDIPENLRKLMEVCWRSDPAQRYSFQEILYRLNPAIVGCVIEMQSAADFWTYSFLRLEKIESIEWNVLLTKLKAELGINKDAFFDLIKTCLEEKGNVTMKKFDIVAKWLGEFFARDYGVSIIQSFNALAEFKWFHSDISRETANSRLNGKPKGTFLIRLSSYDPIESPFCLSLTSNLHFQVNRTLHGYEVPKLQPGVYYQTLEELVEGNRTLCITPCSKKQGVRYPDVSVVELQV